MKKFTRLFFSTLLLLLFIAGCKQEEKMTLLDENILAIHVSHSNGLEGINEDFFQTFSDAESVEIFKGAITSAVLIQQEGTTNITDPMYDIAVEYDSKAGEYPMHGLHLWLGEENEKSAFMYIGDDQRYITTPEETEQLRALIQKNE